MMRRVTLCALLGCNNNNNDPCQQTPSQQGTVITPLAPQGAAVPLTSVEMLAQAQIHMNKAQSMMDKALYQHSQVETHDLLGDIASVMDDDIASLAVDLWEQTGIFAASLASMDEVTAQTLVKPITFTPSPVQEEDDPSTTTTTTAKIILIMQEPGKIIMGKVAQATSYAKQIFYHASTYAKQNSTSTEDSTHFQAFIAKPLLLFRDKVANGASLSSTDNIVEEHTPIMDTLLTSTSEAVVANFVKIKAWLGSTVKASVASVPTIVDVRESLSPFKAFFSDTLWKLVDSAPRIIPFLPFSAVAAFLIWYILLSMREDKERMDNIQRMKEESNRLRCVVRNRHDLNLKLRYASKPYDQYLMRAAYDWWCAHFMLCLFSVRHYNTKFAMSVMNDHWRDIRTRNAFETMCRDFKDKYVNYYSGPMLELELHYAELLKSIFHRCNDKEWEEIYLLTQQNSALFYLRFAESQTWTRNQLYGSSGCMVEIDELEV